MFLLTRSILSSFPLIQYHVLVMGETDKIVIHYFHGCLETELEGERSITSLPHRINEWLFKIQG